MAQAAKKVRRVRDRVARLAAVCGVAMGANVLVAQGLADPATHDPAPQQADDAASHVLSPQALRVAAAEALRVGQARQALRFSTALTQRDTSDHTAWMLKSQALRDVGDFREAIHAARTAWSLSEKDEDRFAAAMIMAQALSSDGKRTRAQLWLRRAGQHAPTANHEALAKDRFRYVQSRNPWRTDLSFTLAPTSNVNNGSSKETTQPGYALAEIIEVLLGVPVEQVATALDGDAQALSGLEYGVNGTTRYRFRQTDQVAQDVFFRGSYRTYVLSDSARRQAPNSSGSDFAVGSAEIGYAFTHIASDGKARNSLAFSVGQSWFGGEENSSFATANVGRITRLNERTHLRLSANLREVVGQQTADETRIGVSAGVIRSLSNGARLDLSIGVAETTSPVEPAEFEEFSLSAGYSPAKKIMGTKFNFGVTAQMRDYDVSPFDRAGREDLSIFATATATFTNVDYYGFNPTVTLRGRATGSNINRYDVNQVTLGVGISSSF
ncbi:tetratricopeptide repeat protein [Tateyamaria sp. ANG-S1]|uniref:tetratricopeptide repeat protein n=1 Tax=Tateyamaria sp. ANG-S1 TaxID=1577905 RepID=UPI0005803250|nr:tetratricopeptide repeat protein [Tateyamaria sp. ANG-S1]KIC50762.1 hypothetical protein RA29_02220 [Tateyamaria sp. ANG-S1]